MCREQARIKIDAETFHCKNGKLSCRFGSMDYEIALTTRGLEGKKLQISSEGVKHLNGNSFRLFNTNLWYNHHHVLQSFHFKRKGKSCNLFCSLLLSCLQCKKRQPAFFFYVFNILRLWMKSTLNLKRESNSGSHWYFWISNKFFFLRMTSNRRVLKWNKVRRRYAELVTLYGIGREEIVTSATGTAIRMQDYGQPRIPLRITSSPDDKQPGELPNTHHKLSLT
jgi:hypothetical protein